MQKPYNRYQWKKRISDEFGCSAFDVIQSYADDGYSKRLTAGSIGITTQTLLKYCRENNIEFNKYAELRYECKSHHGKRGYTNNPWGVKGKPKENL